MPTAPLVLVGLGAPEVEAAVDVEAEELDEELEGDEGVGEGPDGGCEIPAPLVALSRNAAAV